jgi:hypothetical protein
MPDVANKPIVPNVVMLNVVVPICRDPNHMIGLSIAHVSINQQVE